MKRAIARVAMATLAGTMVLGATAAQAGVIKVGITLHMVTETGQKMGQMILDEFEEQNRLGGINGHRLEPILLNDECKSDKGVANMTRLVHQDRVHLVIGSTCSGVTLASMGIATKAEVPQITPHSTNATITMQGSEWIFRASISGRYSATALPSYTAERVGTNIAYVHGSDAGSVGFMKTFQAFMKKHHDADPAYSAQVPEDALDVRTQLLQAKAANPDAILLGGLPAVNAAVVPATRRGGLAGLDPALQRRRHIERERSHGRGRLDRRCVLQRRVHRVRQPPDCQAVQSHDRGEVRYPPAGPGRRERL